MKDYQFVLDELSRLNANDALLAGRLDLERLGAFGWSWGGATVGELCRADPRCKAVVLLDAGSLLEVPPNLTRSGVGRPSLSMNQTSDTGWLPASRTLFAKEINHAFWFQLRDSTHGSFSDHGSLINIPTQTGDPTAASKAQSETIRACMLSFFDKYLKGEDNHLLDNPGAVYPNIINFQSK
jgi:dienelactone hydrolase